MVAARWVFVFGLVALLDACGRARSDSESGGQGGMSGAPSSGGTAAVWEGGAGASAGGANDAGADASADLCVPNPCLNSGTCTVQQTCPRKVCRLYAMCDCPAPFTGAYCETVGTRPACGSGTDQADCSSLTSLEFSDPHFESSDGGSVSISAGDTVAIDVTIANAGSTLVPYPCVAITTDQPTVASTVALGPDVYVWPSGSNTVDRLSVQFASAVPSGTPIHFTVWVDILNEGCTTGGTFTFVLAAP